MKKILRWLVIVLAVAFIVAQFVRPEQRSARATDADFIARYRPPAEVASMLRAGCYDCHSDETRYPWYAEVQPVGWWLKDHIEEAKRELNFSEFGSYRVRRVYRKFEEMAEQVDKGEMPLASYRLMHGDADFTPAQKERFVAWVGAMRDSIKSATPADSLARPRPGS
jgi:hypothetical protein